MSEKNKVLIIGSGDEGKTELMLQSMKERYGNDVIVYTPEEAKSEGLGPEDFVNTPKFEIRNYHDHSHLDNLMTFKSGSERRRERRLKERKMKK